MQVGLKLNAPKDRWTRSSRCCQHHRPTVSTLYGTDWFSVESVIAETSCAS